MMQNIDSKDNTEISDEQETSSSSKQKKSKLKKQVTINENQNTSVNLQSVAFGSNQSPSLLGSYNEDDFDNQDNSMNTTGQKRSLDNQTEVDSPPKKRQRISKQKLNSADKKKKRFINFGDSLLRFS